MNPTSQSPGQAYSSGPNAIDKWTLWGTLAASTVLAFVFTLLLYVLLSGRNPLPRIGFGVLVSLMPLPGAYIVLKVTNIAISWRGVALVYLAMFILGAIIQSFGRLIPVG